MKNNQLNIFVVDDNNVFLKALKSDIETTFVNIPVNVQSFETGESCMKKFKENIPQIVILDYRLNSKMQDAADGIVVLDWMKKESPETNVIMLTSEDNIDIAVKSFHHGAFDYVVKSETKFKKINNSIFNLYKTLQAKREARRYKYISICIVMCFSLLMGVIIAVQIMDPSVFM